jgi:hypothetical protein
LRAYIAVLFLIGTDLNGGFGDIVFFGKITVYSGNDLFISVTG